MCGAVVFVLALTTALGYSVFSFHPFGPDSAWLDLWDFILSNNILPIGSLVILLFCTSKSGWGWDNFIAEADSGTGARFPQWTRVYMKYFVPILIIIVLIMGWVPVVSTWMGLGA